MAKIKDIEGVGEIYAQKLREAGILTTDALLKKCASPEGRKEIAQKTGISGKLVMQWVNHADLFRIKGVSEEYADLLEASGVDTVPELSHRNSKNLYQKLILANEEKKLVRRLPNQNKIQNWIEQAKHLPRIVTY